MDKHVIAARLDRLISDGDYFGGTPATTDAQDDRVAIWFARALDTVTLFLPENSAVVRMLSDARDQSKNLRRISPEAVQIVRIASEYNRDRRGDDLLDDLRQDVHAVITDIYRKSWWFYVPIALLAAAAIFAISGVIQLRDTKVDVRAEAAAALQRAKDSIDQQQRSAEAAIALSGTRAKAAAEDAKQEVERRLERELQTYVADQRQRIATATDQQIELLKRERAPNIDSALGMYQARIDGLQTRVKQVDQRLDRLDSSSDELQRGFQRLDASAKAGTLNRLSVFLNRSRRYVAAELIITSIALLASVILLVTIWWRNR